MSEPSAPVCEHVEHKFYGRHRYGRFSSGEEWPCPVPPVWRVGSHYGIHVYEGDRPVATFHTVADAALAVRAVNAAPVPVSAGAPTIDDRALMATNDAMVWAEQFCSLFGNETVEPGLMVGWFANAMQAHEFALGRDSDAYEQGRRDASAAFAAPVRAGDDEPDLTTQTINALRTLVEVYDNPRTQGWRRAWLDAREVLAAWKEQNR